MSEPDTVERQLLERVDRRLEPGERTGLLKLAGKRFTLGFEFGKDWVRLRKVKRREAPLNTVVMPAAPRPAAVPAAGNGKSSALGKPPEPSSLSAPSGKHWQADHDGSYLLSADRLLRLRPSDSADDWQLLTPTGDLLADELTMEQALQQVLRWLRSELEHCRDRLEFAKVQMDVMRDHASEHAIAEYQQQVADLREEFMRMRSCWESVRQEAGN